MPKKQLIEFSEIPTPTAEPVTKFGGQPVWIDQPAWPLSRETGNQMRFIGQIELREEHGFKTTAKMAYLLDFQPLHHSLGAKPKGRFQPFWR